MNNLTSAFSLYEVLRILLPGFYTSVMLKNIIFQTVCKNASYPGEADGWIIFVVVSVLFGGLLYSLDVARWFQKLYSTLPSNMYERETDPEKRKAGDNRRYFENEYFKFYYKLGPDEKFKTEIQSGFFHLFMTMSFVTLVFVFVYSLSCSISELFLEYRLLNASLFAVCALGTFVMYNQKLKYSWKKDYELFKESLCRKSNLESSNSQKEVGKPS